VHVPGHHVHPAVRQAAKQVRQAQADRDRLVQQIAARGPALEELRRRLAPAMRGFPRRHHA
jgi:hypothetical protein